MTYTIFRLVRRNLGHSRKIPTIFRCSLSAMLSRFPSGAEFINYRPVYEVEGRSRLATTTFRKVGDFPVLAFICN